MLCLPVSFWSRFSSPPPRSQLSSRGPVIHIIPPPITYPCFCYPKRTVPRSGIGKRSRGDHQDWPVTCRWWLLARFLGGGGSGHFTQNQLAVASVHCRAVSPQSMELRGCGLQANNPWLGKHKLTNCRDKIAFLMFEKGIAINTCIKTPTH